MLRVEHIRIERLTFLSYPQKYLNPAKVTQGERIYSFKGLGWEIKMGGPVLGNSTRTQRQDEGPNRAGQWKGEDIKGRIGSPNLIWAHQSPRGNYHHGIGFQMA